MEKLPPLGTAIGDTLAESTSKKTFSYGPTERQQLDVYYPTKDPESKSSPVLIFMYGGGLEQGGKTIPGFANGLAHANMGHFFADKIGYTTVIADYRLISHGARFPSGGEDLALTVEWVLKNLTSPGGKSRDLFLMGNSAGGVNLATFLLSPSFSSTVEKITPRNSVSGFVLKGAIMVAVPYHFRKTDASRTKMLETYFGDRREEDCPLGLLEAARKRKGDDVLPGVQILALYGDLDPEDEILLPRDDFVRAWYSGQSEKIRNSLHVELMPGHNHISPPFSLGTGVENEEAWGRQVASFCNSLA